MADGHRHVKVEGLERVLGIETGIERGIETSRGIEVEIHRGTYRQRPRGIRLRDREAEGRRGCGERGGEAERWGRMTGKQRRWGGGRETVEKEMRRLERR